MRGEEEILGELGRIAALLPVVEREMVESDSDSRIIENAKVDSVEAKRRFRGLVKRATKHRDLTERLRRIQAQLDAKSKELEGLIAGKKRKAIDAKKVEIEARNQELQERFAPHLGNFQRALELEAARLGEEAAKRKALREALRRMEE